MNVRRALPLLALVLAPAAVWGATITITPATLPNGAISGAYSHALTGTGGTGAITWSVSQGALPPGINLTSPPGGGGLVSGTFTQAGTFTFTISATTATPDSGSQAYTINVLGITSPATLPGGTTGIAYSQTLTAVGAVGSLLWSHQTAPLPPGLTLNSNGTITGTPTTTGTYTFVAVATDGSTQITTTSQLSITISPFTITSTPAVPATASVGNTLSVQFSTVPATSGVTWSAETLPPGISLDANAGLLSGQFTQAGTFPFTIFAGNSTASAQQSYSITVSACSVLPALDLSSFTSTAPVGVAFSSTIKGVCGVPPYTFSLTGSAAGAANTFLISSAGVVTGTPTVVGATILNVTITDSSFVRNSSTSPVTISVTGSGGPLTITSTSVPAGTINVPYTTTLTASGGTPAYTWSANAASLPPGLNLSSTGVLSGTPTTTGSTTFSVTVTDSASPTHASVTGSLTMVVSACASLCITTTSVPQGTVGAAYTATTLQAVGGTTPYSWTASGLPNGLTLSTGGILTGTPTVPGTTTFSVTVTDSASPTPHTATASLNIVIGGSGLRITTTSPLPAGTIGVAYPPLLLAASGGTSPFTWTASGLPAGLSLSSTGILNGTPTAAGTTNFSVTVTDSTSPTALTATANLSITINALPLSITTISPISPGGVGIPYSKTFTATGGVSPYTWTASSTAAGLTMSSGGVLSGTPTTAGTVTFFVTVTDSVGTPVNGTFTQVISTPTLTVTTTVPASCFVATKGRAFPDPEIPGTTTSGSCPNPGTAQDLYQFTATGGTAPYTFSLAVAGTLPPGMSLNSAGVLNGTPNTAGSYTFTAVATDSLQAIGGLSATIVVGTVGQPASVNIILGGSTSSTIPAAQQPPVVLSIGGTPFPYAVFGTVTVSFVSAVGGINSLVTFSNGTPTTTFSIPANTNNAIINNGNVLTGTQAGTITLTATQFTDRYGNVLTPQSNSPVSYTVAAGAPVITNVTVSGNPPPSTTGFTLIVTGYSTTRDMTSAAFTFTSPSTDTLASSTVTVPLTSAFTTWYGDSRSNPFGSSFLMTIPFTVASSGSTVTKPVSGVTVTMTNSKGTSNPSTSVNPYP